MDEVTRSLWLPIGRINFFSAMTDPVLLAAEDGVLTGQCRSTRYEEETGYIPHLRESVMRRLMEVLPTSFGYERVGRCELSDEPDEQSRPVGLTMTLHPPQAQVGLAEARSVNDRLREATVTMVTLRIDECGFYTFAATYAGGPGWHQNVCDALEEHVVVVFGGSFGVDRLGQSTDRRANEGAAAVRRYNGLAADATASDRHEVALTPPRGALSFYQLNILVEGLCNQSLLPAVFFEHYEQAGEWLAANRGSSSVVTNLDDLLKAITVAEDARSPAGQTTTLRRFMVISHGSLQWMRRSVESVRRSLLDQMMAVSHRQARLIQLDLAGIEYERTPEMTGEATESQMRGYVMLVATKLPLLSVVAEVARAAVSIVEHRTDQARSHTQQPVDLPIRIADLDARVQAWSVDLQALSVNVRSLETSVEHDWQERLLYEQEQARSEQEAMAEIERSRRGRPEARRMGDAAYNAMMLFLTVIAVAIAVRTTETAATGAQSWWRQVLGLWPVLAVSVVLLLFWPAVTRLRHLVRQRKPDSDLYSFEFSFRLDERSKPELVREYLGRRQPESIRSTSFKKMVLRRLGGWRIEHISADTTLFKVHSVAVVRVTPLRFARFEIVTELMVRKVANTHQYFVRQCRMFGDSPIPLPQERIQKLVQELLREACKPLAEDFDTKEIIALTAPIFGGGGAPGPPTLTVVTPARRVRTRTPVDVGR